MTKEELKQRKRAATLRRKREAYMRHLEKMTEMPCGHSDCVTFNAGAQAIAHVLDWALANKVPTEWLTGMIAKGLTMAMIVNQLTPDDVNGEANARAPHQVN